MKEQMFHRAEKPKLNNGGLGFDKQGRQVTRLEAEEEIKRMKENPTSLAEQE